jgi:phytoene dehydrogenase-like protein
MKMGMSMKNAAKANKEYGKQAMSEFVSRFKNPYIKALFGNYFNNNFSALTFVTSYAFYTSNTAAIPEGGSTGMVSRMIQQFTTLGGRINYSSEVKEVIIDRGHIRAIKLKNGKDINADNYIWAADPYPLFHDMIGMQFMDPNLKYMYENPDGYCANTGYQAAFGINSDEDLNLPEGSVIFPCEKYIVSGEEHDFCGMRVYNYDKSLYPKDKRVIQCNILQNAKNYDRWEDLYKDRPAYEAEKQRIAEELRVRVEKQYPQLEGKLVLLSTYSPITFTKWCNAYKGGYMSFNALKGYKSKYIKSTVKGVSNLFLASQWLQNGGGLPIAAAGGKFAVDAMVKNKGH